MDYLIPECDRPTLRCRFDFVLLKSINRSSHGAEPAGRSHLQATPPARTFPSGTGAPAPTSRWPGFPQCPGGKTTCVSAVIGENLKKGGGATRKEDSPL